MDKYLKEALIAFGSIVLLPVLLIVSTALIPWLLFAIFRGK